MIRTLVASSLSLLLVAPVALGQGTTPAPRQSFPTSEVNPPKDIRPPIKPRIPDCYPDRYGKLICPSNAPKIGDACKTDKGADGVIAQSSATGSVLCLTTGEACWTSGHAGKIWATATSKFCAGVGDACPASSGQGRVFQEGGNLVCLVAGNSCTCASGSTGCTVMAGGPTFLECAQRNVTCPMTFQAKIMLQGPSNGDANPTMVQLTATRQNGSSTVYCNYKLSALGQQVNYSFDCPQAATGSDIRFVSCGSGTKSYVKCDNPLGAAVPNRNEVLSGMGPDATITTHQVSTNFVTSSHDSARTKGFCNYRIDSVTLSATTPCKTPQLRGDGYRCY